eukprot:10883926-Alexandrium_andersonii.AAC.1
MLAKMASGSHSRRTWRCHAGMSLATSSTPSERTHFSNFAVSSSMGVMKALDFIAGDLSLPSNSRSQRCKSHPQLSPSQRLRPSTN